MRGINLHTKTLSGIHSFSPSGENLLGRPLVAHGGFSLLAVMLQGLWFWFVCFRESRLTSFLNFFTVASDPICFQPVLMCSVCFHTFTFPADKCPATRVLPSQLNPSSSVINHLLLGRKPRGGSSRLTSTLPGPRPTPLHQGQSSPARPRCGSLPSNSIGSPRSSGGGAGSHWRAHVRVHRRNMAQARAQLGFGNSEEREDEEEDESAAVEKKAEETNDKEEKKDGNDSSVPPSPDLSGSESVFEEAPSVPEKTTGAEVADVVVQLDSLDLEDQSNVTSRINTCQDTLPTLPECKPAPQVPLLPPPPTSHRHKESDSSGSERNSVSKRLFPTIALTHSHHSSSIPSSSPSTPSPTLSPIPSSLSSPTPASTPTPSTSCLPSSSSADGLSSLPLSASSTFYKTSSPSTPSLSSISSSSRADVSSSPSTSAITPKQQIFSPFPSVKQPRKSAAARNLGLYGPTARTPTVHFPQLSRSLNHSNGAGTTRKRWKPLHFSQDVPNTLLSHVTAPCCLLHTKKTTLILLKVQMCADVARRSAMTNKQLMIQREFKFFTFCFVFTCVCTSPPRRTSCRTITVWIQPTWDIQAGQTLVMDLSYEITQ